MAWKFKQARHYYPGRQNHHRLGICLHDMEAPEDRVTTAEGVADWFASANAPLASAHECCDVDSIVQCVKAGDTAWGAKGGNHDFFHIEQAGYARQSRAEWMDANSQKVMNMSSLGAAELIVVLERLGVPFQRRLLTYDEIRGDRVSGYCGHRDITLAKGIKGGHTDPGPNFPWDVWIPKVEWWLPEVRKKQTMDFR